MTSRHHQRGMTLISMIIMIAVAAFFLVVGAKSLPIYLDHYKVISIMKNLAQQPGAAENTPAEIRESLMRRFDIDMVKYLDEREVLVKSQPGGGRAMIAKYEVRVHMFYNVDAVYVFDDTVPLRN